jgi:hypothetical protein
MKAVLALVLSLVAAQRAHADTCPRWVNDIDPCSGIVAQSVCSNLSLWTPNQWINYKNWNYSSSAEEACRKVVKKEIDPDSPTRVARIDDTTYWCYWDWDEDGDVDDDDFDGGRRTVHRDEIEKDLCCSRVPNNRQYARVPNDPPSHDGQFSAAHRQRILEQNPGYTSSATGTTVTTDAKAAGVVDTGAVSGRLRVMRSTATSPDDPLDVYTASIPSLYPVYSDTAQVDHVIPRVDSNGCPCGSNTSANASVISAELNASMGRNCLDPNREKFLEALTLPGTSAREVEPEADTTTQLDTTAGGCSAGQGHTGGLLLLLGCVLGLRRARTTAARDRTARSRG